jgi:hypothetical protein
MSREAIYKARLEKWKYTKNVKRLEAIAILSEKANRDLMKKDTTFYLNERPVEMSKIEKISHRERLYIISRRPSVQTVGNQRINVISKTPPPSPPQYALSPPLFLKLREKIIYETEVYIKGSFESKSWYFNGNNSIIQSSESQDSERKSLHAFVGDLDSGSAYFAQGKPEIGGLYWRKAFREIEALVRGQYHDIVPNMAQKINDLETKGHPEAAIILRRYIAQSCRTRSISGHPKTAIFKALADLDNHSMKDLEEVIMKAYVHLFDFYLGPRCYNSFVMQMNFARRMISQGGGLLDQWLPDISTLNDTFGPSDRRSLDTIRLRIEVLYQRAEYLDVETQSLDLVRRATMIEGDEWLSSYFHIKGWYFIGMAQFSLLDYDGANFSLTTCLWWMDGFCKIDDTGLFNPEKVGILERLEDMAGSLGGVAGAKQWHSQKTQVLQQISAMDDIIPAVAFS